MDRRWWAGPSLLHTKGRGLDHRIKFSEDAPRPGLAHHISKCHGPAGPGLSNFKMSQPSHDIREFVGPARPGP